MDVIRDFASYLWRLVEDATFRAAAIADAIAFLAKSFLPSPRRPPILDEPSFYLTILAVGFVVAAYRLDRGLRASLPMLSAQQSALRRELRERLIRLRFAIERRSQEPIPLDQALEIVGLAKDSEDGYVIAECEEIRNILERNYNGRLLIVDMFRNSRKDYDSVRARIGYVLGHLEKTAGPADSSGRLA